MNMKLTGAMILSTIAGTLFVTSAVASPCAYSKLNGAGSASSGGAAGPTSTFVDSSSNTLSQFDWANANKWSIAGAGFLLAGGLAAGGMILKSRLKPQLTEATEATEIQAAEILAETAADAAPETADPFTISAFPIVVPPTALEPIGADETALATK